MNIISDYVIPFVIIILAALIAKPAGFMPSMDATIVLVLAAILLSVYVILLWKERPEDERDELHVRNADRLAFSAAAIALLAVIAYETAVSGASDPLLSVILIVMVAAKAAGLLYERKKH
jgi:hypothetical protein